MTAAYTPLLILMLVVAGCTKAPSEPGAAESPTGAAAEAPVAAITPEAAQKAGVEVLEAGPARIRETLTLYGSIKPNAERQRDIRARYPGVVRSVSARAGDAVEKGAVLLTIESNESLQSYAIRAPLGGQVLERNANVGDAVDSSTVLMNIVDLSSLWAELAVFARDLNHVRPGMSLLFRAADADAHGEAKIAYVAPAGHADSQSVVARAVIDNRDGRWVPGQFISADVVIADFTARVAVKPAALQQLEGRTVVFVAQGHGFEPQPVQTGTRSKEAVQIEQGLAAGQRYAAQNSYLIKAELVKGEAAED